MTDNTLPSSVSKYSIPQIASTFIKICKDPKVSKINIHLITQNPSPDIRKITTRKIDCKYNNICGLDIQNAIIRVICYSSKQPKKQINENKNEELILEISKQILILKKELEDYISTNDTEKIEDTKKNIDIKNKMIDKLKIKDEPSEGISPEKMAAIAKRVHEMMTNINRVHELYSEIEYLMKPKTDYVKESMGSDYILPNSNKDRRYNNNILNNWRKKIENPPNTTIPQNPKTP